MSRHVPLILGLVVLAGGLIWSLTRTPEPNPIETGPTLVHELPAVLIEPRIVVVKKARTLTVFSDGQPVATWPIALGTDPAGHKQREGDGRTPEGIYHICIKNPKSRFYLSLGLDYPRVVDAAAALADGRIDQRAHDRILAAHEAGHCPPWDTPLGGEIFIHGRGGSRGDWTAGCVALDDPQMKMIFYAVGVGTPVIIEP